MEPVKYTWPHVKVGRFKNREYEPTSPNIFTIFKSSCEEVMFLHLSPILFWSGGMHGGERACVAVEGSVTYGGLHGGGHVLQRGACIAGRGTCVGVVGACVAGAMATASDGTHPTECILVCNCIVSADISRFITQTLKPVVIMDSFIFYRVTQL